MSMLPELAIPGSETRTKVCAGARLPLPSIYPVKVPQRLQVRLCGRTGPIGMPPHPLVKVLL
jgi:hypothetical protein